MSIRIGQEEFLPYARLIPGQPIPHHRCQGAGNAHRSLDRTGSSPWQLIERCTDAPTSPTHERSPCIGEVGATLASGAIVASRRVNGFSLLPSALGVIHYECVTSSMRGNWQRAAMTCNLACCRLSPNRRDTRIEKGAVLIQR